VVNFNSSTNTYRVVYLDGDMEDMGKEDVKKLLVTDTELINKCVYLSFKFDPIEYEKLSIWKDPSGKSDCILSFFSLILSIFHYGNDVVSISLHLLLQH